MWRVLGGQTDHVKVKNPKQPSQRGKWIRQKWHCRPL